MKSKLPCALHQITPFNTRTSFYRGYVTFFSKQVSEKGAARTLEEFVFSEKYNFQEGRDASTQPEMLARLFDGVVHAFIHVGHGVEFGLKGMLVEGTLSPTQRDEYSKLGFQGLSLAAVHDVHVKECLPRSLFAPSSIISVDDIANRLSSFALDAPAPTNTPTVSKTGGVHVFDIVARIVKDDRFNHKAPADIVTQFTEIITQHFPALREYAEQWTVDLNQPGEVERKMEELVWFNSLAYGVGGSTPNGFQPDFYLCVIFSWTRQ
jgi:hypothetical protein